MTSRRAILFDLFHTLVCVPLPSQGASVAEILGVDAMIWRRLYYEEDAFGRCLGRVRDAVEAMRLTARAIDPDLSEQRIFAAATARSAAFERALVDVEPRILAGLDRLREAGIPIALVSDAGLDDVEAWPRSPLATRFDVAVFSHEVGVRKPDAAIYRHALGRLGVEAGHATFVGDGGSDELRGARALGMRTVLVTGFLERWWPGRSHERRSHADEVHADVLDFVDAFGASRHGHGGDAGGTGPPWDAAPKLDDGPPQRRPTTK